MKKTPLLNIALSQLIASLGHGDMVVIGDAGLPVPPGVALIDLALTHGVPSFIDTLKTTLSEMQVEHHIVADALSDQSPELAAEITTFGLPDQRVVSHAEFKQLTRAARAIVRTGECTPYANIILVAGVVF
ncbi:D-ribose pyranase [Glaciimonas immobilis]|uniref:D-ribose pyranase n=1 Tax=Glaciimonas immobilis TaxID=728004 RepID=A0A840RUL2_9BURK|nr:D-ribose pyranase [Glaciimonas immobilis]KAF3997230.1 D-ribose pyranase [Glaciimonas immobilis]MBB5202277.1 D-ribose pyranase [Glaciimonas immobilis]